MHVCNYLQCVHNIVWMHIFIYVSMHVYILYLRWSCKPSLYQRPHLGSYYISATKRCCWPAINFPFLCMHMYVHTNNGAWYTHTCIGMYTHTYIHMYKCILIVIPFLMPCLFTHSYRRTMGISNLSGVGLEPAADRPLCQQLNVVKQICMHVCIYVCV